MFPFLAGMMQGLLGSGAAGAAAGGAAGGAASGAGAAGMGGGIADLAGSGTMMGGGDSPNMQAFAADMVANPQGPSIDQMPSVGGFAGGGAKGQAPGLMQAQAPGHQNDPLMQGGGMWQKIFGGGI